ncbi:MAG: hypothetical protein ACRERV_00200 [Methylococcales bacterium]
MHLGRLLGQDSRPQIEAMLLEYLRIKNAFHEAMVHDYGADGLLRFMENFARRGFIFGPKARRRARRNRRASLDLERYRMTAALDEQLLSPFDNSSSPGRHAPVRRIEMRVSIPKGKLFLKTLRAWFEGLNDHLQARLEGNPEAAVHSQVGLIFHLIKQVNDRPSAQHATEASGRLGRVLLGFPGIRPFVVGLDAAGDERKSAPRVFIDAFRNLQNLQARHRDPSGSPLIRLGWTFHVGEDVDDLLTGLRHIDEVTSLLLGDAGGRLGHALALGENPSRFYQIRGGGTEPLLGSHLLDLVWAWGRLSDARQTEHCDWIENRIRALGFAARKDQPRIADCYRAMSLDQSPPDSFSEQELLAILDFQMDATRPVQCIADPMWIELVSRLQQLLRKRLTTKPVCIAANPSSNLLVGGYSCYAELPYRILVDSELAVSINTDDPGLFMTSLPAEFDAMYDALKGEMSHRSILAWLYDRCFDAKMSSFLSDQTPVGEDALELLGTSETLDRIFAFQPLG